MYSKNYNSILAELSETFNSHNNIEKDIFSYFNVFRTPVELGDYIVKGYEESEKA